LTRIVDLSIPFENGVASDPPFQRLNIEYSSHEETKVDIANLFPGLIPSDLPDGMGWAVEKITLSTHNGTHIDAPWHYHPTMNGGERAWTIDEVPLDWFWRPGFKLDFRDYPDGYVVQPEDIDRELAKINYQPKPLDIVLMNTAAGAAYGSEEYVSTGCGFGRNATLHLASMGIRVVGTDGWSWDAPFKFTAKKFAETRDPSIIWEGHKAGIEVGYCQIEKLHNLESLPFFGFMVSCFPAKIQGASAGWTRAVAILD
jgi:kynurenine formamidase